MAPKTNLERIIALETALTELKNANDRITLLEEDNKKLRAELDSLKKEKTPASGKLMSNLFKSSDRPSEQVVGLLNATAIHLKEKEKRDNNLILFGLPPVASPNSTSTANATSTANVSDTSAAASKSVNDDDRVSVYSVLTAIGVDPEEVSIKATHRYRKLNGEKPPPVLVEFLNKADRDRVLRLNSRLKGHPEFGAVYISPDLTPVEREYRQRLTKERNSLNEKRSVEERAKFYFGIRNSQIVKLQVKQQRQVD